MPDLATNMLLKITGSREAGELHLLPPGADRELRLSSRGAGVHGTGVQGVGVHGAGVQGAGPSTVRLQECLEPPAWEDAAIPVPAQCQGQEDTGMETRWGWDGPNPPGN